MEEQKRIEEELKKDCDHLEEQTAKLKRTVEELKREANEHKQTEEALRESEERFCTIFRESAIGIGLTDLEGRILNANPALLQILRYGGEELIGKSILEFTHPGDVEKEKQSFQQLKEGNSDNFRFQKRYVRKDGASICANLTASLCRHDKGVPHFVIGMVEDITERERAKEALQKNLTLYRGLIETTDTGFVILDQEGKVLDANQEYVHLSGHEDLSQIRGRSIVEWTADYEKERNVEAVGKCFREGQIRTLEIDYVNAQGKITPIEINASVVKVDGTPQILTLCRDITERKRAEDEIKKLNEELERRVIERTAQLEATNKDMQKEITERRRAEEELKKHEERLEELVKERTRKIKELERQRTEIEKLAAAGLMAARIAHEINNPLAGIKNSFLLVKDAIPQDHRYYEYVGRIETEINRIARIVRQMFDVYRPEQEIKKEFSVDKTIYEVVALLEATWRENNITIEIDSKPITMEMPESLLRQVLYNIFLNAIEASPQSGVVKIMTEADNEILILSISDQGVGIPLEVQSRIFEPFFTSKNGSKKGLGLGLSVSKDIVERLGGHIDFESEPGKGTLFRIILPLKSGERR